MPKPRIAIHNLHKLPNLTNWKIHNYVLELLRQKQVDYLYFDDTAPIQNLRFNLGRLNQIKKMYSRQDLGLQNVRMLLGEQALRKHCDVLLNFNSVDPSDFTAAVKRFTGVKIFHVMDYFWREPGSKKNARLKEYGVDYLMSYSSSDKHCAYFKKTFPDYIGYVLPVPFGYADRFVNTTSFLKRKQKCVALGSVNPLRPEDAKPINYQESASFFPNETWFHKFRRMLVEHRESLAQQMDSLLPIFPKYKDSAYDIVETLNSYQMFTSDESIFFFPSAKTFEGIASGSVLVCSDHPCFSEFGFVNGVNCIQHKELDITDFKERVRYWQEHPETLEQIQKNATDFIARNYSHVAVANGLVNGVGYLYEQWKNAGTRVPVGVHKFWPITPH